MLEYEVGGGGGGGGGGQENLYGPRAAKVWGIRCWRSGGSDAGAVKVWGVRCWRVNTRPSNSSFIEPNKSTLIQLRYSTKVLKRPIILVIHARTRS